jgi:hypothetical protein
VGTFETVWTFCVCEITFTFLRFLLSSEIFPVQLQVPYSKPPLCFCQKLPLDLSLDASLLPEQASEQNGLAPLYSFIKSHIILESIVSGAIFYCTMALCNLRTLAELYNSTLFIFLVFLFLFPIAKFTGQSIWTTSWINLIFTLLKTPSSPILNRSS